MKVGKVFEISYAHRIPNHPGECKYLHGHNGKIEVEIEGSLNTDTSMLIDFGIIKDRVDRWLKDNLDHRTILEENDEIDLNEETSRIVRLNAFPTAEALAVVILNEVVCSLVDKSYLEDWSHKVRFWETSTSYAEVSCKDTYGDVHITYQKIKALEKV